MSARTLFACDVHAPLAFQALMGSRDKSPGDRLVLDSCAGCPYCTAVSEALGILADAGGLTGTTRHGARMAAQKALRPTFGSPWA